MSSHVRTLSLFPAVLLLLAGCLPGVDASNPWDPDTPESQQQKGRITGSVSLEPKAGEAATSPEGVSISISGSSLTAQAAADGSFTLTEVPAGIHELVLAHPGYATETIRGVGLALGAEVALDPARLLLARGDLSGTATLAGAGDHRGISVEIASLGASAQTDSTGAWQLTGVPTGRYTLAARKDGYATHSVPDVTVTEGQITSVTAFELAAQLAAFEIEQRSTPPRSGYVSSLLLRLRFTEAPAGATEIWISEQGDFGSGAWESFQGTTHDFDLPATSEDGSFTLYVRFRDTSSVESSVFAASAVLDREAPTGASVVIDAGADFSTSPDGDVSLTLVAADETSGVSQVKVAVDGVVDDEAGESFQSTLGPVRLDAPTTDGHKTVAVVFIDRAGNESAAARDTIYLDRTAPSGTVTVDSASGHTQSPYVRLILEASEPCGADYPGGCDAGGNSPYQMALATRADFLGAAWFGYVDDPGFDLTPEDGEQTVYVKFRDRAGNESAIVEDTVILDRTPPSGTRLTINGGKRVTNDETLDLTLMATDAAEMIIAETQDLSGGTGWIAFAGAHQYTLTSLDEGLHTIYARFRDDAGNESEQLAAAIALDQTPPGLPGIAVQEANAADHVNTENINLELSAQDASEMQIGFAADLSGASWEELVPVRGEVLPAPDGDKTIYARFRDDAGNQTAIVSTAVTLDTALPLGATATISAPGVPGKTGQHTVQLQLSDVPADVVQMKVSNESAFSGIAPRPLDTDLTWVLYAGDGQKTVYVQLIDRADNAADIAPAPSIEVDTEAPDEPEPWRKAFEPDTISICWSKPSDDTAEYRLQRKTGDQPLFTDLDAPGVDDTCFDDTDIRHGERHQYRLLATDDLGNPSDWSAPLDAGVPIAAPRYVAVLREPDNKNYLIWDVPRGVLDGEMLYRHRLADPTEQPHFTQSGVFGRIEFPARPTFEGLFTLKLYNVDQDMNWKAEAPFGLTREPLTEPTSGDLRGLWATEDLDGRVHILLARDSGGNGGFEYLIRHPDGSVTSEGDLSWAESYNGAAVWMRPEPVVVFSEDRFGTIRAASFGDSGWEEQTLGGALPLGTEPALCELLDAEYNTFRFAYASAENSGSVILAEGTFGGAFTTTTAVSGIDGAWDISCMGHAVTYTADSTGHLHFASPPPGNPAGVYEILDVDTTAQERDGIMLAPIYDPMMLDASGLDAAFFVVFDGHTSSESSHLMAVAGHEIGTGGWTFIQAPTPLFTEQGNLWLHTSYLPSEYSITVAHNRIVEGQHLLSLREGDGVVNPITHTDVMTSDSWFRSIGGGSYGEPWLTFGDSEAVYFLDIAADTPARVYHGPSGFTEPGFGSRGPLLDERGLPWVFFHSQADVGGQFWNRISLLRMTPDGEPETTFCDVSQTELAVVASGAVRSDGRSSLLVQRLGAGQTALDLYSDLAPDTADVHTEASPRAFSGLARELGTQDLSFLLWSGPWAFDGTSLKMQSLDRLEYVGRHGGAWEHQLVYDGTATATIEADAENAVHVVYADKDASSVFDAVRTAAGWQTTDLQVAEACAVLASARGPDGSIHVLINGQSSQALMYLRYDGAWQIQNLDRDFVFVDDFAPGETLLTDLPPWQGQVALAGDAGGVLHAAYLVEGDVRYARLDPEDETWQAETVDEAAGERAPAMLLDDVTGMVVLLHGQWGTYRGAIRHSLGWRLFTAPEKYGDGMLFWDTLGVLHQLSINSNSVRDSYNFVEKLPLELELIR